MKIKKGYFIIIIVTSIFAGYISAYYYFFYVKKNNGINAEKFWIYKEPKYSGVGTFSPNPLVPNLYYCQEKIKNRIGSNYSDTLIMKLFNNDMDKRVLYSDSSFFMIYFVEPPIKTPNYGRKIGEWDFIITPDTIYKILLKPVKLE